MARGLPSSLKLSLDLTSSVTRFLEPFATISSSYCVEGSPSSLRFSTSSCIAWSSGGTKRPTGSPIRSCGVYPKMRSTAGLTEVKRPSRSSVATMSLALSTSVR